MIAIPLVSEITVFLNSFIQHYVGNYSMVVWAGLAVLLAWLIAKEKGWLVVVTSGLLFWCGLMFLGFA